MANFFHDDFLLKTETAKRLFHDYARDMPIFDFHCHLDPKAIFENANFADITEAWLGGDHYKWRIMRTCGIDEKYITGDADSLSKFKAFAGALKYAIGSPIYHWAHMELRTYFGINEPLTEANAEAIYNQVNALLATPDYSLRRFIEKSNVQAIYTTDDPIDSLEWHDKIKADSSIGFTVAPAFRPDKAINLHKPGFVDYIAQLGTVAGVTIDGITSLENALANRIQFFDQAGCVASDHGIDYVPFAECTQSEADAILKKVLSGATISEQEINQYQTYVLQYLAGHYTKLGWAMEVHYGAIRGINSYWQDKLGPDTGFDSIGEAPSIHNLAKLFDSIEKTTGLPKTMVFNINPNDNYLVGTLIGGFQQRGNLQFGTAWWFNDHINGMTAQINALADVGVLGKFVGMLTDSRSFLSYPRHDYFRRILCNIVGQWMEDGLYNPDIVAAGELIKGIAYNNAVDYFKK